MSKNDDLTVIKELLQTQTVLPVMSVVKHVKEKCTDTDTSCENY